MIHRIERALARAATEYGVDALLLVKHEAVTRKNVQYLTGFTGSSAYVLVAAVSEGCCGGFARGPRVPHRRYVGRRASNARLRASK